jgi:dTDP-4-dehydrorhamnose 3,5-epimerase
MHVTPLKVKDSLLLRPRIFGDERGFFLEMWNRKAFRDFGLDVDFVQDNHSRSGQHVLRGLHYQVDGHSQGKLVWVSKGTVFDVIVDLREDSPTFGQWDGILLTDQDHERLWAPPGCAHGFFVMSDIADFHYKCTDYYAPKHERVLKWDDAEISVDWPIPAGVVPSVNAKDAEGVAFATCTKYVKAEPLGLGFGVTESDRA